MECPPRLKHGCNRSTDPGSWQSAGSSIMPKHVVLAHWLTRFTRRKHRPTVSVGKLTAVNGVPLSPQAQVQPKRGFFHCTHGHFRALSLSPRSRLSTKWVASFPRSAPLASSTGATEAHHCFSTKRVASFPWRAPLASSTGTTEAGTFSPTPISTPLPLAVLHVMLSVRASIAPITAWK